MITQLQPDILECKVKWNAKSSITMNKDSGGDRIPAKLFQILKADAVKVLYLVCQQIWKRQQWPPDWKMSIFIPIPKGNGKECSNYHSVAYIFPFLLCFSPVFFSQLFVRPPQTAILLFCISFPWGWS